MYYDIPKLKSHQPSKFAGAASAAPAPPPFFLRFISKYLRYSMPGFDSCSVRHIIHGIQMKTFIPLSGVSAFFALRKRPACSSCKSFFLSLSIHDEKMCGPDSNVL